MRNPDYTHLINASSPRSLILTVSLLWFNFRIARHSGVNFFRSHLWTFTLLCTIQE